MFWVFWDKMIRRVRIHRSDCSACRQALGEEKALIRAGRGITFSWEDFPSYAEARRRGDQLQREGLAMQGSRMDCGLCHPERPTKIVS